MCYSHGGNDRRHPSLQTSDAARSGEQHVDGRNKGHRDMKTLENKSKIDR